MKKSKLQILSVLAVSAAAILFTTGCSKLKLQEEFKFVPETAELTTFKDKTVWEWIQTNPNNEFNYLIQAINLTGMQADFSTNTELRTYFLLKDAAFTGNSELMKALTGSATAPLSSVAAARLKAVLQYHMIEKYIDQGPDNMPTLNKDYLFQTLLPGDAGLMSIRRTEFFALQINFSPALPNTKKGTSSLRHNYIFKNGIAHLSVNYLRAVPF